MHPPRVRFYNALVPLVATVAALGIARVFTSEKYTIGYAIYGTLAAFGIVIPSALVLVAHREVQFPTLFETFRRLRLAKPRLAATLGTIVAAGLGVLTIHLALYPWPDITKEPTNYAGLDAKQAREKARVALGKSTTLRYSMQARGVDRVGDEDKEAWLVFFSESTDSGGFGACVVAVRKDSPPHVRGCSQ
ncbi:MAG TPA: hypothetical protein VF101_17540 [Gaiellaceae bacterium]